MEFKTLIDSLNKHQNGAYIKVVYDGELPLNAASKKLGIKAHKTTEMTIRKGIDYDKQKSVQAKVADGKVLTHELPWGQWKEGYDGLIIEHKGNEYVRFYSSPNKSKTTYFVDGVEKTYEELKAMNCLVGSFFKPKTEKPDAMTININNIIEIS